MKLVRAFQVLCLFAFAGSANATLFDIEYVSNNYGSLGSFTIDDQDIIDNIGDNPLGWKYVLNDFIQDLNFSYNGMSWTQSDIALGPTTAHAFDFIDGIPQLISANGALASNELGQRITMYHPSVGVRFGSEFVLGNWVTTQVSVPEPSSLSLLALGALGLILKRKKA